MAVRDPQRDNRIRGGAETWDKGLAGALLVADYFPTATPPSGSVELIVTPATYVLTGADAAVRWGQRVDVTPAAFAIGGQAAEVSRTYRADVLPGAYTVAGSLVDLAYSGEVPAAIEGQFVIIMRRRRRR
jgi:hypothetical protein